jgi:hypothetical protein
VLRVTVALLTTASKASVYATLGRLSLFRPTYDATMPMQCENFQVEVSILRGPSLTMSILSGAVLRLCPLWSSLVLS